MTLATIQTDLRLARAAFWALNRRHFRRGGYRRIRRRRGGCGMAPEKRLVRLAEKIARLEQFASWIRVKETLELR